MLKFLKPITFISFLMLTTGNAQASQCGKEADNLATIAEVVTFKLADGVTDEAFVLHAKKMQEAYLCQTKGFVRRTLSKNDDGTWIDHVEWSSKEDALAAMQTSQQNNDVLPFLQSIKPESVEFGHWRITTQIQ